MIAAVLCAVLLACAPNAAQEKSTAPAAERTGASATSNHGSLPWLDGSFEAIGLKSKREQRPVFVYLWSGGNRWCRHFESEALSQPKLAAALDGWLLWNADAAVGAGKQLSANIGANAWPVILFFDDQGRAIERLDGYLSAEEFLAETARVLRNEGTLLDLRHKVDQQPDDLELRTRYAYKLQALGDAAGRDREIEQIRRRDRNRTSLPMRREVFADRMARIQEHFDSTREINPGPLVRFLEEERYPELLFEGTTTLAALHLQRADELEQAQQLQAAQSKRADLRATLIKAWACVPKNPALQVEFAVKTVSTFAAVPPELSATDRAFLVSISAKAVGLDPDEGRVQACVAMAAYMNGDKTSAQFALRRARELEPENQDWTALAASLGL